MLTTLEIVLIILVLTIPSALIFFIVARDLRYIVTRLLYHSAQRPKLLPEQLRSTFSQTQLTEQRKAKNHSHPESACARSGASSFFERIAMLTGHVPYFIQKSRADERNRREGSRTYYWAKDLTSEPSYLELPIDPLKIYIDVDYYVDMPNLMIDDFCPTALYTVQPTAVARDTDEYSYTFDQNNFIHFKVCGGGDYTHQLWNYGIDNVLAVKSFWGIPYKAASYLVDRKTISTDRDLVLLTPVMKWDWKTAWLTPFIQGKQLDRLNVVHGEFLRLQVHTAKGVYRSTARVGNYSSAYCTAIADDTIAAVARLSKVDLNLPQVMTYMDGDRSASVVMLDYHKNQTPSPLNAVYPVEHLVQTFSFSPEKYEVPKPSLVAFMQPIHNACFSPAQGIESEKQAIKGRIEDVRQPALPMTKFLSQVMMEFVEKFVPGHKYQKGIPVDVEEVYARQNRPSQKIILKNAEFCTAKRKISMFLKKEAYANVKDPRPISQINGVDKRDYSRYIYSLADHLKTFRWYAFGRSPKEIAAIVAEICELAEQSVTGSDFSKFDGHGSNIMRELELMVLLAFFRVEYHKVIIELHNSQFNLRGFSTSGVRYKSGYSRASGSPETAAFNSIFNAFVSYLAKRLSGLDMHAAWLSLGIYGGDDGLTADMNEKNYHRAARMVGQVLTLSKVDRGNLGVSFLARMYTSEVWYGSPNSCCDIQRQVAKFHTTIPGHNIKPEQKLQEKALSFLLSDAKTPLIGLYCQKALEHAYVENVPQIEDEEFRRLTARWNDQYDLTEQYPNEEHDDFQVILEQGIPSFDKKRFENFVNNSQSIQDLLNLPICSIQQEVKTDKPCVVNDEVYNESKAYVCDLPPKQQEISELASAIEDALNVTKNKYGTFEPVRPKPTVTTTTTTSTTRSDVSPTTPALVHNGQQSVRPNNSGDVGNSESLSKDKVNNTNGSEIHRVNSSKFQSMPRGTPGQKFDRNSLDKQQRNFHSPGNSFRKSPTGFLRSDRPDGQGTTASTNTGVGGNGKANVQRDGNNRSGFKYPQRADLRNFNSNRTLPRGRVIGSKANGNTGPSAVESSGADKAKTVTPVRNGVVFRSDAGSRNQGAKPTAKDQQVT